MIPSVINIVSAKPAGDFKLALTFDDGKQHIVDFRPFLSRAIHPSIRAYLDPQRFSQYCIQNGELVWGDFDLCFPVADLYLNKIDKHGIVTEGARVDGADWVGGWAGQCVSVVSG